MKVKFFLVVITIVIISFLIWLGIGKDTGVAAKVAPPTNQFVDRIKGEIDSLKNAPTNAFCSTFYNNIQYHINDYHKQSFLGNDDTENNQWKEILSKNLYSAYAPKFVEQATYVFKSSDWGTNDLNIIRSELRILQSSTYLKQGSSTAEKFKEINAVLGKYDEIVGFISSCSNFSYSQYGIGNVFPNLSDKINKSRAYLSNNLDNSYVNNCTHLKEGLREIPRKLYEAHVGYLRKKIQTHSGDYESYNSQRDYYEAINKPLIAQIEALNNNIYGINNGDYDKLTNLLSVNNRAAVDYFHRRK